MPGVRLYVRDLVLRSKLREAARVDGYPLDDPHPSVAIVDLSDPRDVAALEADDPSCKRVGFYPHVQTELREVADRVGAEPVEKRKLFGRHGLRDVVANQYSGPPPADAFADDLRKAVVLAADEAVLLGHHWIGTEHLLLGLWRLSGTLGAALGSLPAGVEAVRARLLDMVGSAAAAPGDRDAAFEDVRVRVAEALGPRALHAIPVCPPFTPRAIRVLELATVAARDGDVTRAGSHHLLMALIREGEGLAPLVLDALGVRDEAYQRAVDAAGWGALGALVTEALGDQPGA